MGGEGLLLEAADRQNATLQGDLAGHADGVLDGPSREQRGERGDHGHTRTGAVLGDGSGGDVNVELAILEGVLVDSELLGVATDVGEGDLGRLLHDVAQLAGEHEGVAAGAAALHGGGLDEQHVASGAGDGQAGCDTGCGGAGSRLLEELLASERVAHDLQVDLHGCHGLGLLLRCLRCLSWRRLGALDRGAHVCVDAHLGLGGGSLG